MKERPANTERSTIPSRRRGRLLKRSAMAVMGRKTGSGCWGGFIISSTARRAPDPIGAAAWRAHPHAHLCMPIWPVTGQPHPRNGKEEGTTGVLPTVAGTEPTTHDTQPLAPWVRAGRQEISRQMANGHMVPEMSPLQIVLSGFRAQAQGIHGDRTGCSRAINGRRRCKRPLECRHRPERYGDLTGILFRGPTTWATQWPQ